MSRLRRALIRIVRNLEISGGLGLLLLVYALGMAFLVQLPENRQREQLAQRLQQREASLAAERAALRQRRESSPQNRLEQFYQSLPAEKELLDSLATIHALAEKQELKLQQAQYKFAAESGMNLAHYEITLPITGKYPQQRRFIELALAELPALELRDLVFKRDSIGKENVEAVMSFVLHVRTG